MAMILTPMPGASIFSEVPPVIPTNYTYSVTAVDFNSKTPLKEPYLSLLKEQLPAKLYSLSYIPKETTRGFYSDGALCVRTTSPLGRSFLNRPTVIKLWIKSYLKMVSVQFKPYDVHQDKEKNKEKDKDKERSSSFFELMPWEK